MPAIPESTYLGPLPSTNFAQASGPRAIVGATIHHIDGSIEAADATFHTVGRGSSAEYGVSFEGEIFNWLDPLWQFGYHACQAQWEGYIGVECESDANDDDDELTVEQIDAIARIAHFHGIPGVAVNYRGQVGIGYHRQFAPSCSNGWGSTYCPGNGIVGQIPTICAAINGQPPNPEPETGDDDVIYSTEDNGTKQFYREARGYLVPISIQQAAAHAFAGVRVVPLGGVLAAIAFNIETKQGMDRNAAGFKVPVLP